MFPLKCSFNEKVGHLIKLLKTASPACLLLFVLQAPVQTAETLPQWKTGKDLNQKKKSNCLHFTHSGYTDCSPMICVKALQPQGWMEGDSACINVAGTRHKKEKSEMQVSHQTWKLRFTFIATLTVFIK